MTRCLIDIHFYLAIKEMLNSSDMYLYMLKISLTECLIILTKQIIRIAGKLINSA